jgi:hypothetical protein
MTMKTVAGDVVVVADEVILAAAGRIYQARRRTCAGPTRVFRCRWCECELRGRAALELHERGECAARPTGDLIAVTSEEMRQLAWVPPDAA